MNSIQLWPNLIRFVGLVALQVLLFQQVSLTLGPYFNVLIYPLFILLLPMETPTPLSVFLGFAVGFTVDMFYGTLGLHASAGTFSGFLRAFLLKAFEPKGGYSGKELLPAPHYFDWQWFLTVSGLFVLLHCFWFFSVDTFTLVYIGSIALKALAAWGLSMIFVVMIVFLFNPKH